MLIDESGLLMAPLLRRTWAPKGETPVLHQQGAHRQKVSLCAALWLSPRWERLGLFCRRLVNGYFDNTQVALFLEGLLAKLKGQRLIVLWDGGTMHKGAPILAPAKLVQYLKGSSSRRLQEEFPSLRKRYWGQHLWARGYFCATVGAVDEKTIKRYIEEQKWDDDGEGQFRIVTGR